MRSTLHPTPENPSLGGGLIERRAFLKGLAATLTLPWMPSFAFAQGNRLADKALPPRRFVCLTFGNGVYEKDWWVKAGANGAMEFSSSLEPLAPFAEQITALRGLRLFDDTRDEGGSGHMYYFTNLLSGAIVAPGKVGADITADQIMAAEVGKFTDIPSLALGTEPVKSGTIFGAPAVCASTISWRGPTSPVPAEIYPQQAFDRLFNAQNKEADKSVLDYVLTDLQSVKGRVNYADRQKLEEYTSAVRELEQRISRSHLQPEAGEWQPDLDEPEMARPASGMPSSVPEHIELMNEIVALALRMDKTRVATFVMAQDVTNRPYGFIEGVDNAGLHGLSHHGSNQSSIDKFKRTNRWHSEQAANLVRKLQSVQEDASGTLLDNTMLLYTATMNDGDRHDPTNLTPLLIGGRNCEISPGQVRDYSTFEDRRICNLHLSLLHRMGIRQDTFGNSFHPLDLA